MHTDHDGALIRAAFAQPASDGSFQGALGDYLGLLGTRRPAVIFAFPPKAAGTFLRSAAIEAIDGQLVRVVHAQGGRDAQFYLPTFLAYYSGGLTTKTLVTHVHMQALKANTHFLDVFDLKPIVMMRPILDMLASYWDMLDTDPAARREGLNCMIPHDFMSFPRDRKADYLIEILAPWYAGYYATWLGYARAEPGRTCILNYAAFLNDPAKALGEALAHANVARPPEVCERAIANVWNERVHHRFNRGVEGRGKSYFTWRHIDRVARMLDYYGLTDSDYPYLLSMS
ncbi:MAG TPA: hypothetical protein VLW75_02525 [Rhizomicrobium sp.]|nr:hypothetical protein [Rhizomicrobium sp.]